MILRTKVENAPRRDCSDSRRRSGRVLTLAEREGSFLSLFLLFRFDSEIAEMNIAAFRLEA
jgi:hypothetical protein